MFSRLRERWLALLPEIMPFIAELLEDTNPEVESTVQDLVRDIEELSGESLNDYLE